MKNSSSSLKRGTALAIFGLVAAFPMASRADDYTWTGSSSTFWDQSETNWVISPSLTAVPWTNAGSLPDNNALFNQVGGGTVNVIGDISVGNLTIGSGAGLYTFSNDGNLTVTGSYSNLSATSPTITNTIAGQLYMKGSSSLAGATVLNGGSINLSDQGATASIGTIGTVLGSAGGINVESTVLTVGNLTLSSEDPNLVGANSFAFKLTTPDVGDYPATTIAPLTGQGRIRITGGFGASTGVDSQSVDISLTSTGPVLPGTYTLIDWTGATVTGNVSVDDFVLSTINGLPPNVSRASLVLDGSKLLLVAVPEPSTVAMPLAACLGLLVLRRRAAKSMATV